MARWGSLDLGTKMDMYRAKLDLELDAHDRLLQRAARPDRRDAPGSRAQRPGGPGRRGPPQPGGLPDRRIELARFGPLDRLAARFGRGKLASRLRAGAPAVHQDGQGHGKKGKAAKPAKPSKAAKAAKPAKAPPAKPRKTQGRRPRPRPNRRASRRRRPRPRRSPRRSTPTRRTREQGPSSSTVPPPLRRRTGATPRRGVGTEAGVRPVDRDGPDGRCTRAGYWSFARASARARWSSLPSGTRVTVARPRTRRARSRKEPRWPGPCGTSQTSQTAQRGTLGPAAEEWPGFDEVHFELPRRTWRWSWRSRTTRTPRAARGLHRRHAQPACSVSRARASPTRLRQPLLDRAGLRSR